MKKKAISLLVLATTICFTNAKAQTKPFTRGTFDRVGVNVGVGTEGVSLSVASVYTNFLEVWKSHTNLTHPGKYFRPSKVKIMRPTSPK